MKYFIKTIPITIFAIVLTIFAVSYTRSYAIVIPNAILLFFLYVPHLFLHFKYLELDEGKGFDYDQDSGKILIEKGDETYELTHFDIEKVYYWRRFEFSKSRFFLEPPFSKYFFAVFCFKNGKRFVFSSYSVSEEDLKSIGHLEFNERKFPYSQDVWDGILPKNVVLEHSNLNGVSSNGPHLGEE